MELCAVLWFAQPLLFPLFYSLCLSNPLTNTLTMDPPVTVGLAKSTMHTCLFPYKVGKWDPITSAHWRHMWRRMLIPGLSRDPQSHELSSRSPWEQHMASWPQTFTFTCIHLADAFIQSYLHVRDETWDRAWISTTFKAWISTWISTNATTKHFIWKSFYWKGFFHMAHNHQYRIITQFAVMAKYEGIIFINPLPYP